MDVLLSRVTQQAMSYAIKSGVTIAATYTIKQCANLLQKSPSSQERDEVAQLQSRLETKIRIVSPAIDMIELITARGHTSLESAVVLTKEIRLGIQVLGHQLTAASEDQELEARQSKRSRSSEETTRTLRKIIVGIRSLIDKIDDAVPLINLAITTSGVNLSTRLATTISPSRLLQASTLLVAADSLHSQNFSERIQVGPTFTVSLYMLFAAHASRPTDADSIRGMTWKEVIHKAHVKLVRDGTTTKAEFSYRLVIIEDLDDDRVHETEDGEQPPGPYDDVLIAGIREFIRIHELAKLFYADNGKILNINDDSEENKPVLLLKRDLNAGPSSRTQAGTPIPTPDSAQHGALTRAQRTNLDSRPRVDKSWSLPADLDPEWIALEVYTVNDGSDDDSEDDERLSKTRLSLDSVLATLSLGSKSPSPSTPTMPIAVQVPRDTAVKTSLSLLEMLIKLTALQQFRQESHLAIEDELLNFFLEESSTAGTGSDKARRQQIRRDASNKIGFDPYDESPVKRHRHPSVGSPRKGMKLKLNLQDPSRRQSTQSSIVTSIENERDSIVGDHIATPESQ